MGGVNTLQRSQVCCLGSGALCFFGDKGGMETPNRPPPPPSFAFFLSCGYFSHGWCIIVVFKEDPRANGLHPQWRELWSLTLLVAVRCQAAVALPLDCCVISLLGRGDGEELLPPGSSDGVCGSFVSEPLVTDHPVLPPCTVVSVLSLPSSQAETRPGLPRVGLAQTPASLSPSPPPSAWAVPRECVLPSKSGCTGSERWRPA